MRQFDREAVASFVQQGIAALLFLQAAGLAVELLLSLDDIKYQAYNVALPDDGFGLYLLFVGLNLLIIGASLVLGIYWLKTDLPKVWYFLPLSVVAALYGGFSLMIPAVAFISWWLIRRTRRSVM
ncbi:hypothetical protein BGP77_03930 [Saccharospirillum sp. MSK14-1]|uniref:hypothetical protein n=1 Tax=Saccharospirillum sp. MSK14-1 TaxID=1897632 RepID=UPI000D3808A7|nr:hypothetical protein [Saccharospirillum sp. MSK14-1]PTY36458.1 hypothetical protein BGP77_03930 [Saccharospirillum sp. MSK14-1]